ncbi:la-related protein 1C isoform X2 [Lactuca sativa]|uniref:la-related protein 1C isoform X2 n=1 Tax=Lactuca sativa TaxID=4236 RepID=UPI000CD86223|nr:la-related protein 1C isoform X2 [Lactuca sativa]
MASINLQSRDGGGDDSSRSPIRSRGVSSPWSKIVRGDSGELPLPVVSVTPPAVSPSLSIQEHIANPSSDCSPPKAVADSASSPDDSGTECQSEGSGSGGGGSNAVKKPVWSKPSNGVVEVVSPVMGAVSWPALGESTKPSPKSSSSESLQSLSDGSLVPAIQVTGNPPPSSHKLALPNHVNPTSTPNNVAPSGQRSLRRGGGNSGGYISSNGGFSQRSPAIQDPKVEAPRNTTTGKPANVSMDSYPKDQRGSFGSQPNSGNNTNTNTNDHHHQRNSYRRGNGGQHPRGNQEWNQHRSFNNMQPQRGGFRRGFVRPSVHSSTPFIPPQMHVQVRPFGNNFMYPDMGAAAMFYVQGPTPPDPLRSIPLVSPMQPPIYFPVPDPDLHKKIEKQIEYYFSNENLVRDIYLRQKMDDQGWVPVNIIASFKKVSILTDNVQLILDVMRTSKAVEVQGEKMRRRNEWMKWVLPSSINQDSLASQLRGIGLDDVATANQVHMENFSGQQSQQQGTVA